MCHNKLGDLATIKFCSVTPSRSKRQSIPTKWLVCANFLPNNEVNICPITNDIVPDDDWLLSRHDIVIKRIEPSFVNFIDFETAGFYCGNNLIIVTPKEKADSKYFAMILNDRIGELSKDNSVGAVMKSISRNALESMEIPMPDENNRRLLGELWYKSIELKKKKIRLAELENERTSFLIHKSINISGGNING